MVKERKILVAEDHFINQELMKEILSKYDCLVETVENGREALEKVATGQFDLVFMDIQMPEMDGLEAARKIRQMEAPQKNIPIVALTAGARQSDYRSCMDAGMDDCLAKPFEIQEIESLLNKYITRS